MPGQPVAFDSPTTPARSGLGRHLRQSPTGFSESNRPVRERAGDFTVHLGDKGGRGVEVHQLAERDDAAPAEIAAEQFQRRRALCVGGLAHESRDAEIRPPRGVLRLPDADDARQTLGAFGARNDPEVHFGLADLRIRDSDTILDLKQNPRTLAIYGAGVVGCEYASMFRNLGLKVNLVNTRQKLLEFLDDEIIDALSYHLRDRGVILRHNEKYTRVEGAGDGVVLHLESGKQLKTDVLLWANGRTGNSHGLGLEALGFKIDSRGYIAVRPPSTGISRNFRNASPGSRQVGLEERNVGESGGAGQEVLQQAVPGLGEDRLGMELDPLDGEVPVAQPHHHPVRRLGRHLQAAGQRRSFHDQRVVPGGFEGVGNTLVESRPAVADERRLAVHHLAGAHHPAAVQLADALVAEAHPEHGDHAREGTDHVVRHTGVVGRARTG